MPAPAVHTLTSKMFTRLARAVQEQLRSQGVDLPKGSYCHVLEATARGLGFSSKSALDSRLARHGQPVSVPTSVDETSARAWLVRSGVPEPIAAGFLVRPAEDILGVQFDTAPLTPFSTRTLSMTDSNPDTTSTTLNSGGSGSAETAVPNIVSRYASHVWATADVLRGVGAKASEWPTHMMPFFALMLLESRALRARRAALADFAGSFDPTDTQDLEDLKGAYAREVGTGKLTWHDDLVLHGQNLAHVVSGGPAGFTQRLRAYLAGFDEESRQILGVNPAGENKAYLNIDGTVRFLQGKKGDHLFHYCQKWAAVDLVDYDSSAITTLEEHIKRKWADISADTAGEHYTPADLIDLTAAIATDHFRRHPLPRRFLRIYDPTCGGGNLLFGVEDAIRRADEAGTLVNRAGERYSIQSFGQELNDHLFALAKVESWFRPDADIREGNTLSEDRFDGQQFDLIVANPPYGTDWKQIQAEIEADETGRFPDGCRPPVSDGQHLFLQHIQHHLADDGVALTFCSGSTLFSGDADGGESNARSKYILTDDGVLGIIQLPKNEFFNTGINTYIWVFKKSKPDSMQGRMFLLNAETLFSKLRKSLGNKNSEITQRHQESIVRLMAAAEVDDTARQAMLEEGAALTVSTHNRMGVASIAGWVRPDGSIDSTEDDLQNFTSRLEALHEIHLKTIKAKEGTPDEPALLRLMSVEDVHYSKVFLELTRTNDHGALEEAISLSPMVMQFDNGGFIHSSWDLPQIAHHLTEQTGAEVGADAKSIERALKELIQSSDRAFVMEAEGRPSYDWQQEERALSKDGQPLGRARLDIKVKVSKKKAAAESSPFDVTFGPDIEKDTETAPFKIDETERAQAIEAFLARWVKDPYSITQVQTGCEINFNRLFPKTGERKTLAEVNQAIADLDAAIARLHKGGV